MVAIVIALIQKAVFHFLTFRIDMHEMLGRLSKVFDECPKLIDRFNQLLPPDMPLSSFRQIKDEVLVY